MTRLGSMGSQGFTLCRPNQRGRCAAIAFYTRPSSSAYEFADVNAVMVRPAGARLRECACSVNASLRDGDSVGSHEIFDVRLSAQSLNCFTRKQAMCADHGSSFCLPLA